MIQLRTISKWKRWYIFFEGDLAFFVVGCVKILLKFCNFALDAFDFLIVGLVLFAKSFECGSFDFELFEDLGGHVMQVDI